MAGKKRSHGDGGLYKIRGGKLWRGVVDAGYDENGKRIQKYVHARTKRACRDKLDELKEEIRVYGAPLSKSVTVAEWAPRWLETLVKPNVDPKTYSGYKSAVNRWIIPTLRRKKIAALKPSDVAALRAAAIDAGRSTSTARYNHTVLSLMLDAAKAERLCRENVAEHVTRPPISNTVNRGSIDTADALRILEAAAKMPDAAGSRWWFKLLTGQRQGEILGALITSLDFDVQTYSVDWKLEEVPRQHGCGGTCGYKRGAACPKAAWRIPDGFDHIHLEQRFHLTRPKSQTSRIVPLIPQLVEAIKRHLKATEDVPNPHGLIWRNEDGSPITAKQDAAEWRELLQKAGIADRTITGHWARHTVVTILASLGIDHQLIGEIVGHSSTKVTEIYRHAQAEERMSAMKALGGVWEKSLSLPPA